MAGGFFTSLLDGAAQAFGAPPGAVSAIAYGTGISKKPGAGGSASGMAMDPYGNAGSVLSGGPAYSQESTGLTDRSTNIDHSNWTSGRASVGTNTSGTMRTNSDARTASLMPAADAYAATYGQPAPMLSPQYGVAGSMGTTQPSPAPSKAGGLMLPLAAGLVLFGVILNARKKAH